MWGEFAWGEFMWGGVVCPSGIKIVLSYLGNLAAGETLVIDIAKKTATLDGVNVLKDMSGTFYDLLAGANTITYEDSEGSRTLVVTVTYKDKWL